jgi:hypothetical protein
MCVNIMQASEQLTQQTTILFYGEGAKARKGYEKTNGRE